jgi:hypothetical protein
MDIDPHSPCVPLINTVQLLGVKKTSFQYSPDICCMCLLRGPNWHIHSSDIYLASRQSVSSWRPELPSSSLARRALAPSRDVVSRLYPHRISRR